MKNLISIRLTFMLFVKNDHGLLLSNTRKVNDLPEKGQSKSCSTICSFPCTTCVWYVSSARNDIQDLRGNHPLSSARHDGG